MDKNKYLKDNTIEFANDWSEEEFNAINRISNISVGNLLHANPNLLVFPKKTVDQIEEQYICNLYANNTIQTYNLLGFLGVDNLNLTIGSRFTGKEGKEYFLQYMLQKISSINLVDFKTEQGTENLWEFLLYFMFPYFLKNAYRQGIFKCYEKQKYNDSNVKGKIDLNRHFKNNIPFLGNIAYNTRELSYNNAITHLIRHTIEYIQNRGFSSVLTSDADVINAVQTIREITPDYTIQKRLEIINKNIKRLSHPYFTEYEPLRKICVQILNRESTSFNRSNEQIQGILIDGAWLWEEYLNTILKDFYFIHPEARTGRGSIKLFENHKDIYPDFYQIKEKIVIDAKYKRIFDKNEIKRNEIKREDMYQLITYMYRLKAKTGILAYPLKGDYKLNKLDEFKMHPKSFGGKEGKFITYGMRIPQNEEDFNSFQEEISQSEKAFKETLFKNEMIK